MDVLSSEWLSDDAAEYSHNALETAYELGAPSLGFAIIGAGAEDYVNHLLREETSVNWRGPEEDNSYFAEMVPWEAGREIRSFNERVEELEGRGVIDRRDVDELENIWDYRNEVLHGEVFFENPPVESMESSIELFEEILGYEGESIRQNEMGDRERMFSSGSSSYEQYLENLVALGHHESDESPGLLLPASILGYRRVRDEIGGYTGCLEDYVRDELTLGEDRDILLRHACRPKETERLIALENQVILGSHSLGSYEGLNASDFAENLEFFLDQLIEGEGEIGELFGNWHTGRYLDIGTSMFKVEELW